MDTAALPISGTHTRISNVCPACFGMGKLIIEKPVKMYGGAMAKFAEIPCPYCNTERFRRITELKASSNIPYDAAVKDFDWEIYPSADLAREKELVEAFIFDFHKFAEMTHDKYGLYIASETRGTGKTFLSSVIGNEYIGCLYPKSVKFISEMEILNVAAGDGDPIRPYMDCNLLIIDDMAQKKSGTDWLSDIYFRIIDHRYLKHKPIIVTSNLPLKKLTFDDRIVDRLNRMCEFIHLPEYSVRAAQVSA